jgi:hypothetical protein
LNALHETGKTTSGELIQVKKATYAEAAAKTAQEVGKWRVEANLTQLALTAHEQAVTAEIKADPARYIETSPPERPA